LTYSVRSPDKTTTADRWIGEKLDCFDTLGSAPEGNSTSETKVANVDPAAFRSTNS
jgi:hypothetical protein